jgi:SAM-dependent methyltransferase
VRKLGQGVWNIVRFNWHFYAGAGAVVLLLCMVGSYGKLALQPYAYGLSFLVAAPTIVSLLVSCYVYDTPKFYSLAWLSPRWLPNQGTVVNIHAGFDETSALLQHRFADAKLLVFDFYNPVEHTEVSIRRARAAYPAFPGTQPVQPQALPIPAASADLVVVMLAAHEIRQPTQRLAFFKEIRRILQPQGRVVVVEHLRDPANFLAYTIGFLHFYSRSTWQGVFRAAGLYLEEEKKITPFVSAFILQ